MDTYIFDIDDTLCRTPHDLNYDQCVPILERIEAVNKLYKEGNRIYLYTGRHVIHESVTQDWMSRWHVKYHNIFYGKPVGNNKIGNTYYVDDKAINSDDFFFLLNK